MNLSSIKRYVLKILILYILFPVIGIFIIFLVGEKNQTLILLLMSPYIAYIAMLTLKTWFIRCPRCDQTFFRRGIWFGMPFSCNHCDLSIFDSAYDKEQQQ